MKADIKYIAFLFFIFLLQPFIINAQDKPIEIDRDSVIIYPVYCPDDPVPDIYPQPYWMFRKTMPDGKYIQFYAFDSSTVSQIGEYREGKRQGYFYMFYKNGNLKYKIKYNEGTYMEGLYYYPNGLKEKESIYKDSKKISSQYWFENGKPDTRYTQDTYESWYKNGNKKFIKGYRSNKLHGTVKVWYPDGQLMYQGEWMDNKPLEKHLYAKEDEEVKPIKYNRIPKKHRKLIESVLY